MRLRYLGTGAAEGMPALFCSCPVCLRSMEEGGKSLRMRSCSLLGDDVLIDLSPDIFAQKLRFSLRLDRVRAVVFTHAHPDHMDLYALETIGKASCSIHPDTLPEEDVLHLYGSRYVKARFERIFAEDHVLRSRFCCHEVRPYEAFSVGGYTFHPLRANHRPIEVEDCLIYAIEDGQSALLYANDTGRLDTQVDTYLHEKGIKLNLLSMDCARGLLPGDGHMGFAECQELMNRLKMKGIMQENARYILNHLSHMHNMTHREWEQFAAPYGVEVAYDGLEADC